MASEESMAEAKQAIEGRRTARFRWRTFSLRACLLGFVAVGVGLWAWRLATESDRCVHYV